MLRLCKIDEVEMSFVMLLAAASVAAGAIASVAGFGIGSLLTPVLALRVDMKLAVAAVAIPHLVATALRLSMMRQHVDWRLVRTFGVMSAAGGLAGALLQQRLRGPGLVTVFGGLLVFAGLTGLAGLMERVRLGRTAAWVAGLLSGVFGGLVGNQGGIRAAALLGFDVHPAAFVASATAAALMVDLARMPVYVAFEADRLVDLASLIALASIGAIAGTIGGERVLRRIPPPMFKRFVSALVLALGVYMLVSNPAP
jgi:uncharacterized membrane protein YfcA